VSYFNSQYLVFADHGHGNNVGRDHKLCAVLAASSGGNFLFKKIALDSVILQQKIKYS